MSAYTPSCGTSKKYSRHMNTGCNSKNRIKGFFDDDENSSATYKNNTLTLAAIIQEDTSYQEANNASGPCRWYPHELTDGAVSSNRIDQILSIDGERVLAIQKQGGNIILLDFGSLQEECVQHFTHDGLPVTGSMHVDAPLVIHQHFTGQNDSTDYYLADVLGSITELITPDGLFSAEMIYNSFGQIKQHSGIAVLQPYSFTSREYDDEVDLYYYRSRYYDAETGRFLTQDKMDLAILLVISKETKSGRERTLAEEKIRDIKERYVNTFAYASNNPVNFTDPTGLALPALIYIIHLVFTAVLVTAAVIYLTLALDDFCGSLASGTTSAITIPSLTFKWGASTVQLALIIEKSPDDECSYGLDIIHTDPSTSI